MDIKYKHDKRNLPPRMADKVSANKAHMASCESQLFCSILAFYTLCFIIHTMLNRFASVFVCMHIYIYTYLFVFVFFFGLLFFRFQVGDMVIVVAIRLQLVRRFCIHLNLKHVNCLRVLDLYVLFLNFSLLFNHQI